MTEKTVVDTLPYINHYEDPDGLEAAYALVEEECRNYPSTKNYLARLPRYSTPGFETTIMHNEFKRLEKLISMEIITLKDYEFPPLPPTKKLTELDVWTKRVNNLEIELKHQEARFLDMELMLVYNPDWQMYLQTLENMEKSALKKFEDLRKAFHDVNWENKSLQTLGDQLQKLEEKWVAVVTHNYEVEQTFDMADEYL